MTLLPHQNWNVTGVKGDYPIAPVCSVPYCGLPSEHRHHIWRRSHLKGDYGWVRLWDDTVVGNLCGLCLEHHEDVTGGIAGHRAWIQWQKGEFRWYEPAPHGSWRDLGRLDPQPPLRAQVGSDNESRPAHVHLSAERCPTCGREPKQKRERKEGEKPPPKKSMTIKVPDEVLEDGHQVLTELKEACGMKLSPLGYDEDTPLYYVVTAVMAHFLQCDDTE